MTYLNNESWLEPYLPEGGRLALDIGANEGHWTALLAGRFQHVHSFDPNPQILEGLRARVDEMPNVMLAAFALHSHQGVIHLNLFSESQWASIDPGRGGIAETIEVACDSLDNLGYVESEVDFIKIDTEAAEVEILKGAMETLRAHHPHLIIEIHIWEYLHECQALLVEAGYTDIRHIPHPHSHRGHCWLVAYN